VCRFCRAQCSAPRRESRAATSDGRFDGDLAGDDGERKPGDQDEADEGECYSQCENGPGRAIRVAVEARSIVLPHGKTSRLGRGSPIIGQRQPTLHRGGEKRNARQLVVASHYILDASFGRFGRAPLLDCAEPTRSNSADTVAMSSCWVRSIESNRALAACSHFLRAKIRPGGRS
jgi:hypothetical protein